MHLEPISSLRWAYQLHYYLIFRTHLRRSVFSTNQAAGIIAGFMEETCSRHDYHLLKARTYADHIRCLVSLRPDQSISTAVRIVKSNSSGQFVKAQGITAPLWARGFFARSVGRVRIAPVRKYLERQAEHHGYASRHLPPAYRYRVAEPALLSATHAHFELAHHVVLKTRLRRGIFSSQMAKELGSYWLRVAEKRGFAIDQISTLPDHVHLIVRTVPKLSIEDCVLSLMNNGQHFLGETFPDDLISSGVDQVWEASAYSGTCGSATTASLKAFLARPE